MALSRFSSYLFQSQIISRNFRVFTRLSSAVDAKFEEAKAKLNTLENDPGNDIKLKMYALFKQATIGDNSTPKPGAFNFVGQAKWAAWNELGSMSQDDAKQAYVDIVSDLEKAENK